MTPNPNPPNPSGKTGPPFSDSEVAIVEAGVQLGLTAKKIAARLPDRNVGNVYAYINSRDDLSLRRKPKKRKPPTNPPECPRLPDSKLLYASIRGTAKRANVNTALSSIFDRHGLYRWADIVYVAIQFFANDKMPSLADAATTREPERRPKLSASGNINARITVGNKPGKTNAALRAIFERDGLHKTSDIIYEAILTLAEYGS